MATLRWRLAFDFRVGDAAFHGERVGAFTTTSRSADPRLEALHWELPIQVLPTNPANASTRAAVAYPL